jgi:hypothetical protein
LLKCVTFSSVQQKVSSILQPAMVHLNRIGASATLPDRDILFPHVPADTECPAAGAPLTLEFHSSFCGTKKDQSSVE